MLMNILERGLQQSQHLYPSNGPEFSGYKMKQSGYWNKFNEMIRPQKKREDQYTAVNLTSNSILFTVLMRYQAKWGTRTW